MNSLAVFYEHIFEAAEQSGKSAEEVLRFAKACGIDYLECDTWRLSDRKTKRLFDACNMGVSSVYGHFDFLNDSAEKSREKYIALLENAAFFGAQRVLCIPGFFGEGGREEQLMRFCEGISRMCEQAKTYNITVTVEDFDDINSPCCRTEDLLFLLCNVSGLRYTFDTGNFRYCLEDAAQAYGKLRGYVAHVHCKDRSYDKANANADLSNGKADLSGEVMYPVEVCGGVIGIDGLLRQLKRDGYGGILAIEHFGAANQLEYIGRSADNIRRIMEEV